MKIDLFEFIELSLDNMVVDCDTEYDMNELEVLSIVFKMCIHRFKEMSYQRDQIANWAGSIFDEEPTNLY